MKKQLTHYLTELGMTQREVQTYLALLPLGHATGYQVAEQLNANKSTTYIILEELRKKGLITKSVGTGKHFFVAKDLQDFVTTKRKEVEALSDLVPDIQAVCAHNPETKIEYLVGGKQVAQAACSFIRASTSRQIDVLFTYTEGTLLEERALEVHEIYTTLLEEKCTIRAISPHHVPSLMHPVQKIIRKRPFSIRTLDFEKFPSKSIRYITDGRVLYTSRGDNDTYSAVTIKDQQIADTEKYIFNILWEQSKPFSFDEK